MDVTSLYLPEAEGEASTDQSKPTSTQPIFPHHLFLMPHSKRPSKKPFTSRPTEWILHTLIWPGGAPINEFTTEGYFSMDFPTLFPTGAADFLGVWSNQVTIGNYFTHLLKYDDGRFARHPASGSLL